MAYYQMYVVDDNGKTAQWSHTNGHRGKACLTFPDDEDLTIVLEHETQVTYLRLSADGVLELDTGQQ